MYDVIIIGAGPAGISAALYAKRANLNVVVLYHGESQLDKAHKIDNYYGFENGISGPDLYAAGITQAKNLGVEVLDAEVTNIQMASQNSYMVTATNGDYEGHAIILATGNKKLRPNLKGLLEHEGKVTHQRIHVVVPDISPAQRHFAAVDVPETGQKIHKRRLSAAGRTYDGRRGLFGDLQ